MYGYAGRILEVDLKRRSINVLTLKESITRKLIGGRGLGTYLLLKMLPAGIDPLSGENVIVVASGPLNNTRIPMASKLGFFFKSPLTGGYGESYVGGGIPRYPKASGYDAVIIKGSSQKPTYILISEDGVEFVDASELWGLTTIETDDILRRECGAGAGIACIGPAGENMVRFACICVDKWRQAGRCGGGAVMGAKKLKAIVMVGKNETPVKSEEALGEMLSVIMDKIKNSRGVKHMRKYGTSSMAALANEMGFFPTMYWRYGRLDGWEGIGPEAVRSILVSPKACWNCPVACGRYVSVDTKWGKIEMDGPEYETIYAIGGLFGVRDIADLIYINYLADIYGIDTITLGNVLGFAVEASRRGKIPAIDFGDVEKAVELIKSIAYRNGVGSILAEGVMRAAERLGLSDIAIHVKGLEPAGYDPRVLKSMSLAYAVSPRGACHLRSMAYIIDIRKLAGDPDYMGEDKIRKIIEFEDWMTSFDCLILCKFGRDIFNLEIMWRLFTSVTGINISYSSYIGNLRTILMIVRYFNEREGISGKYDVLPDRMFREQITTKAGPRRISREDFKIWLRKYYRLRGMLDDGSLSDENRRLVEELIHRE